MSELLPASLNKAHRPINKIQNALYGRGLKLGRELTEDESFAWPVFISMNTDATSEPGVSKLPSKICILDYYSEEPLKGSRDSAHFISLLGIIFHIYKL
jgi:hypothetical protein